MSSLKPIKKAVFPVAGLGTRFLPATKAIPKEMLPIIDRPLIQYAVDEAREAGIEQMIFVTGRGKTAIVEHFDVAYELEATMSERGKSMEILEAARATPGKPSLTASFVSHITTCLPWSTAAVATRKATVTFSASSIPVVRLTSAFPPVVTLSPVSCRPSRRCRGLRM